MARVYRFGSATSPTKLFFAQLEAELDTLDGGANPAVHGPGSSTDNAIARWDGTGGADIQNSVVLVSDEGRITVNNTPVYNLGSNLYAISLFFPIDSATVSASTNLHVVKIAQSDGVNRPQFTVGNNSQAVGFVVQAEATSASHAGSATYGAIFHAQNAGPGTTRGIHVGGQATAGSTGGISGLGIQLLPVATNSSAHGVLIDLFSSGVNLGPSIGVGLNSSNGDSYGVGFGAGGIVGPIAFAGAAFRAWMDPSASGADARAFQLLDGDAGNAETFYVKKTGATYSSPGFIAGSSEASSTTLTEAALTRTAAAGDLAIASGTNASTKILLRAGAGGGVLTTQAQVFSDRVQLGDGVTPGTIRFLNATSGQITVQPATGALGTQTITLPAASGIVALTANPTSLTPAADDGAALGSAALQWSDLFLASGGTIVWNSDVTITHQTNYLSFSGADLGFGFETRVNVGNHVGGNLTFGADVSNFEVLGNTAGLGTQTIGLFNATGSTKFGLQFYRSKNATVGSATVVASGDQLGGITWYGAQQTGTFATQNTAAQIRAEVDGTVTSGAGADMPGRIILSTTPDGSGTLTDRLILDSAGVLKPNTNDGVALGTTALSFSDLFFASGAVIAFAATDATLTHGTTNKISYSTSVTDVTNGQGWNNTITLTNTGLNINMFAVRASITAACSGTAAGALIANQTAFNISMSGGATLAAARGFAASIAYTGASPSGTVTEATAFLIGQATNGTSGTPSLTITSAYGLRVEDQGAPSSVSGFTFGTSYAIHVAAQTNADGGAYSLLTAGAGLISIGDTTEASAVGTASTVLAGGLGVAKRGRFGGGLTSAHATEGLGYATGAGGTITQGTSRTTAVTLNKITGAITLVSAAGSTTPATFTVNNTAVAATDTVVVNQKSGTDDYEIHVTAIAANSFDITFFTTGGTTTEQPVFNFTVIKGATS